MWAEFKFPGINLWNVWPSPQMQKLEKDMNRKEYLITCLIEELAEMQMALSKCLRFTTDDVYKYHEKSNISYVNEEFSHVIALTRELRDIGVIIEPCTMEIKHKRAELKKFMEYSKNIGSLYDSNN